MEPAPFHAALAGAPDGVRSVWLRADDGVRLRAAVWGAGESGQKGTVLLFQGRTEYIEKFGPAAGEFTRRGLAMATLDFRGQGLSDRLIPDPALGHVEQFSDYQRDVAAFVNLLGTLRLPEPWVVLGHSMGGCIALRSLMNGLPVRAAAFSAPMWGVIMPRALAPVAGLMATVARLTGRGRKPTPSTSRINYALTAAFEDNTLTRDRAMWDFMRRQMTEVPALAIGAPTMQWFGAALAEMRALARRPAPALPCYAALGGRERIVEPAAIHARMKRWPNGTLDLIAGAEHELMMELPEVRMRFYDGVAALFASAGA